MSLWHYHSWTPSSPTLGIVANVNDSPYADFKTVPYRGTISSKRLPSNLAKIECIMALIPSFLSIIVLFILACNDYYLWDLHSQGLFHAAWYEHPLILGIITRRQQRLLQNYHFLLALTNWADLREGPTSHKTNFWRFQAVTTQKL